MSVQALFQRMTSRARVYACIMLVGLTLTSQSCGIISDPIHRASPPKVVSPSPAHDAMPSAEEPAKIPSVIDPPPAPRSPKPSLPRPPRIVETGMASWYGPGFHGKTTASGEIFNQERLTAAHPRLPWGSRVKITNLTNGKSVEVRINDRGPFVKGRIIDVSRAAARTLGMVESGIAHVRVEWLSGFETSAELVSESAKK